MSEQRHCLVHALYTATYSIEYDGPLPYERRRTRRFGAKMLQNDIEFPVVADVEGGVTDDGQFVLLQVLTVEGAPVRVSLRPADLEKLVTFLLRIAAIFTGVPGSGERTQYQPIPACAISAGELADGMGCLGVTVGGTELMFQLPVAALSQVAQTLLMVGTPGQRRRMS